MYIGESLLDDFSAEVLTHNTFTYYSTVEEIVNLRRKIKKVDARDIMVSFDIVPLFTKVPVKVTMDLLGRHSEEDVLRLFRHVLTISYFTYNEKFYGQTDGVAMGSPLSPVKQTSAWKTTRRQRLNLSLLKPRCWFRCVDDTFVIWQHGPDKLKDFLHHLNSIHQSIQFTMETESEGQLPFLDFDIYRRPEASLGHKVYRKPTHTNLFLNAKSHHHPSNTQAVLSTLIHRARALCDEDSLQAELVFLKDVFKENSYNDRNIHRALNRRPRLPQPDNEPHSVAFLPFVGIVFNRISRVLARHNIKSVGLPQMKLSSLLRPVKDHLGLKTPGVYRIPCQCGRIYIWQTGRSVDIR
jgi:hypothetical protein